LPGLAAHQRANLLVLAIVGAQCVAVRQHHRFAEQRGKARILEHDRAGQRRETAGRHVEEKIPVAAHREQPASARGDPREKSQGVAHYRIGLVIADPGFEQVAEQEHVSGPRPGRPELFEEQRGGEGIVVAQVHVGGKKPHIAIRQRGRHRFSRDQDGPGRACDQLGAPMSVIDSMTTGSVGTSL
jgi:hypothetical protein